MVLVGEESQRMSLAAYQRTAQYTETPRNIEARLLGDVCRELTTLSQPGAEKNRLREALDWNRRVWNTLTLDCANPENPLPAQVRANVVSLGLWVSRYTEEAMWNDADIAPLIDINQAMIKGLMGRAAEAA